ncbi:MAG TPA: alkaline phosphatase D family protein [Sphingomicrobium sp.]|nr:alkaline phosphatase D family protein [Sphingomicrobium sp.]
MASNSYNRREFMTAAAAIGASLAWSNAVAKPSRIKWTERRDLYPEGVASGDPSHDSVMLWTRRPYSGRDRAVLTVEVAEDQAFKRVVSATPVTILAEADWTARVLAAGLKPARVYWYRFTDSEGNGSRSGRTITAPAENDPRPVRFAFVSCQTVNEGALNAYRRMIWEDDRAPPQDRLGFILHLGDFIYEVVQYPEEVKTRYDRTIYDIGKVPDGRKVRDFHVPTTLEGYRFVYRAHLHDPDLQDARARFPFIPVWDNHEFSWRGWQSNVILGKGTEPAQELRVAANQAWFEYQPARVRKSSGPDLASFDGPEVATVPIERFDDEGLGAEPNNLAAINSLTVYRALRYGRNVDLIITDQHSYRMEEQSGRPEVKPIDPPQFPNLFPEEAMAIIDGGRAFNGGNPPDKIKVGSAEIPNFRKDGPPYTLFGRKQREWLKQRLTTSTATWKIWGSSGGTLDWRADPQNLPEGMTVPWPGSGYAGSGGGDFSAAFVERAEIYDSVRDAGVTNFVTVSGDRHSFWAGYAAKALPPAKFEPVGVAFITGSLSAPGLVEAFEHSFPKDHPLRPLYLADRPGKAKPEPTVNLTLHRGVKSALEYARSGDIERARTLTNPDVSPHLEFIDMGGHGYATVKVTSDSVETEFLCIPRPIRRSETPDGGPILYRVTHKAERWQRGERPRLIQRVLEGDPKLST